MQENDCATRINKLDAFFLWVASLSGIGFSIFIGYFKLPWIPYIPIFIILSFSVFFGYLQGAVFSNSFSNRIRGWNYLIVGLLVYVPMTSLKLSENYLLQYYSFYPSIANLLTTTLGIVIVVTYIVISRKLTPLVYKCFLKSYESVSKQILNRTLTSSFVLGFALFVFVLTVNQAFLDISSVAYILFIISLIAQIYSEERRIRKLLNLEKYQSYIGVQIVRKTRLFNIFLGAFSIISLFVVGVAWFPSSNLQITAFLILFFVLLVCVIGLYASLFYYDRGDMVTKIDACENKLSEEQLDELNRLVNLVNK